MKTLLKNRKTDPEFITKSVKEEEFLKYVDYIESYEATYETNIQSICLVDKKITQKEKLNDLFPIEEFNNLEEKCKLFVMESCNDATKQYIVAKCLIEGQENFPQNTEIAVKYFEQAIGGGNLDAVKDYSNYLIKGKIIPQDLDKAKSILEKNLESGNSDVLLLYG